jgi:hypothetical protein
VSVKNPHSRASARSPDGAQAKSGINPAAKNPALRFAPCGLRLLGTGAAGGVVPQTFP